MGLSHSPRIVIDGLVMALDAANVKSYPGSGTAWYDMIGSNDGTLTNGPTFSSHNGGSIIFDGTNDYVDVSGSTTVSAATFLAWVRLDGDQNSNAGVIFNRGTNITGMNFRGLTEEISYHWNNATNTYGWNSGLTVPHQEWCMMVVTVTSSVATGYLFRSSGTTSATNNVSHGSTTLDSIEIGRDGGSPRFFGGRISVAMIYNRALSLSELQSNYNALKERYAFIPTLVQDGLVLNLDAGDTNSYPGSGTTWTDLSSNSNNGTLTNGPTYSSADGGSIVFDGTDDYVSETSGLSDSFLQGNWTISFWVNFDVISTNNTGRILLQHGTNSTRRGLHLEQRNSSLILGLYSDDLSGSQTLSAGTWYNITFTLNSTTRLQQIFIDGSLDNSRTANGAYVGTGSNTRIGGRALSFSSHLDGKISNVVAYNRVLSAQEISQNYNLLKDRY